MTVTAAGRATIVPPSPPSAPRLRLASARADQAVLDGGWWPRSTDPIAELPGLIVVLGERYGPIRQLMLNSGAWDTRPRRLAVGTRVLRIGWFASIHPALAVATTENGDQLDLLVVPPGTATAVARSAMERAADAANTTRAPDLLAAVAAEPAVPPITAAGQATGADEEPDNEGSRPRRAIDRPAAAVTS